MSNTEQLTEQVHLRLSKTTDQQARHIAIKANLNRAIVLRMAAAEGMPIVAKKLNVKSK